MLVVEQGAAIALSDGAWLNVLERIAAGHEVRANHFGAEIGPVIGDVAELARLPLAPVQIANPHDPYGEIVVVEDGEAVALRPNNWLAFLADRVAGGRSPLSSYGPSLGPIGPDMEAIGQVTARRMAFDLREDLLYLPCPAAAGECVAA